MEVYLKLRSGLLSRAFPRADLHLHTPSFPLCVSVNSSLSTEKKGRICFVSQSPFDALVMLNAQG